MVEHSMFPPHTRGCTPIMAGSLSISGVSPAHAGMYPLRGAWQNDRQCFPRTRGDVPRPRNHRGDRLMFPPHTRGCTARSIRKKRMALVSPAHAGMYPFAPSAETGWLGFPRTRGDVPCHLSLTSFRTMFPPHTRGCTSNNIPPSFKNSVSPAHAGMYPYLSS